MSEPETASAARPYHHGDLKTVLLRQAETILERDGIQRLTLRGAARAAGVSHAAPSNHFRDMTGLLSELAAVGFNRLRQTLVAARAASTDLPSQAVAVGQAYATFARAHPGLFLLMFRSERLDTNRPALRQAMDAAAEALRSVSVTPGGTLTPLQLAAHAAARWSLVHGYAMLLLDGRLHGLIGSLPGGETADDLLRAVLAETRFND